MASEYVVWARSERVAKGQEQNINKEDVMTSDEMRMTTAEAEAREQIQKLEGEVVELRKQAERVDREPLSKAEQLADELAKVSIATEAVIKADGPMSLQDRAQNANATRDAQARYLREMSPAAAAAWDLGRAA